MKLMIRAHDLGIKEESLVVKALQEKKLDGVQLVAYKCTEDIKYEKGSITPSRASDLGKSFSDGGFDVALIGAYFNPVHPDDEKIRKGIDVFKDYLDVCKYLGCNVVGSETGSYNGDPWIYHPENHSDAALERVVSVFSNLADYALSREEYIGMEGAFGHVCHTPERLFEAIQRINKDNIRIIFDLYNYLDISNFESAYEILDRGLDLFGEKILLFHIKDFVVDGDKLRQCGVGRGILDYDKIITKIYQHNPDAILVLEGTTGEDIDYALSFLREKINKVTYYSKES